MIFPTTDERKYYRFKGEICRQRRAAQTVENADGTKRFIMSVPAFSTYLTSFVVGNYVKVNDSYKKRSALAFTCISLGEAVRSAYGKT